MVKLIFFNFIFMSMETPRVKKPGKTLAAATLATGLALGSGCGLDPYAYCDPVESNPTTELKSTEEVNLFCERYRAKASTACKEAIKDAEADGFVEVPECAEQAMNRVSISCTTAAGTLMEIDQVCTTDNGITLGKLLDEGVFTTCNGASDDNMTFDCEKI